MAEQLICNQQVDGSTPFTSSTKGRLQSGQMLRTVNPSTHVFDGSNPSLPTILIPLAIASGFLYRINKFFLVKFHQLQRCQVNSKFSIAFVKIYLKNLFVSATYLILNKKI